MAATRGRKSETRAERRERIRGRLMAAVESFLADGRNYAEVSVEELINEAGLARSTFYFHFRDKSDLLRALTEGVYDEVIEGSKRWIELDTSASRPELADALRGVFDPYRHHQDLMVAVSNAAAYDPAIAEEFREIFEHAAREVAGFIARGQKAGDIHKDLDPESTAAWLAWMWERGLYFLVAGASDKEAERHFDALVGIFWHTLYVSADR